MFKFASSSRHKVYMVSLLSPAVGLLLFAVGFIAVNNIEGGALLIAGALTIVAIIISALPNYIITRILTNSSFTQKVVSLIVLVAVLFFLYPNRVGFESITTGVNDKGENCCVRTERNTCYGLLIADACFGIAGSMASKENKEFYSCTTEPIVCIDPIDLQ